MYEGEEVFLAYPDVVQIIALMTKELSTHFGSLDIVSTGTPFSSVKYPPPEIIRIFEVYALIAVSDTMRFLKSLLTSLMKFEIRI